MKTWIEVLAVAVLLGAPLAVAQSPASLPKKECTGITSSGDAPGNCAPNTCFFLGPYCNPRCSTITRSGGQCVGSSTLYCVMSNQTFTAQMCQDCGCSGLLGNCTNSGSPQPTGTVMEMRCIQQNP